ncbi:MAG: CoA transferase [Myxococcales bacterium]|nr:CoA transferase [Myxococcales bacterium]
MSDTPGAQVPGPLSHLHVLDLTVARAGPTCTRQLADMGAGVIHVASPRGGFLPGSDTHNLQRNKRSISIDLKNAAGRDVFLRLADRADVVVENFRANVKHRLGIDYATLSARNPRLVYASISGFGQDGPYASRPGVDQIAQGMGGLMSVTGPPGSGPWRAGIAVSDTAAGTFLTQGILAALIARDRTGRGQWVHTSLLESMINFMDFQATRWLVDGEVPGQAGNDHPTVFPMGTFRTADGYINIAAMLRWDAFVEALGATEIAADPRFANFESRTKHRDALMAACEARLVAKTTDEWVSILNEAGLPCGPILAVDEVFEDPQVRHLEMAQPVVHPVDGELDLVRLPLTFSETPASIRSAAPLLGADTERVLVEHGFAEAEIATLAGSGAISLGSAAFDK